jgi:hypothetical protein
MADHGSGSIDIAASPADIMHVIADFDHYQDWAGPVRSCHVLETGGDGLPSQVRFSVHFMGIGDEYVNGYTWHGDERVTWTLVEGKSLKAQDGSYILTPKGSTTLVEYDLTVELKVPLPGLIRRRAQGVIIDSALKDLKKAVEGQSR